MSSRRQRVSEVRVLIAGGGVAALEAALALRALAAGRVSSALVAPDRDFVYRQSLLAEVLWVNDLTATVGLSV